MTTVVSRLYDQVDTANRIADKLRAKGFPDRTLTVIEKADVAAMTAAQVSAANAERYAAAMTGGQALLVCRAPFTPFGAARVAMAVADSEPWIEVEGVSRNDHISVEPNLEAYLPEAKVKHELILTSRDYVGSGISEWQLSKVFNWPTISKKRDRKPSVIHGTRYMSRGFWPGPLLSNRPRKIHVLEGEPLMSKRFGNLPVLKPHKKGLSVMTDHPKFSERFGLKTISERR